MKLELLYRYECRKCGEFEAFQTKEKRHEMVCPACGQKAQKLIDTGCGRLPTGKMIFYGGWYPNMGPPTKEGRSVAKWNDRDECYIGSLSQLRDVCNAQDLNSKYLDDTSRPVQKRSSNAGSGIPEQA